MSISQGGQSTLQYYQAASMAVLELLYAAVGYNGFRASQGSCVMVSTSVALKVLIATLLSCFLRMPLIKIFIYSIARTVRRMLVLLIMQ
mmetsp:Transcript_66889/g.160148  ORF Transcript_66889/g.160148 Transcript_66889/m.160148 type:complete len:89 (-) Transcript_66889:1817-2083(-)